jgi:hypothetical protein
MVAGLSGGEAKNHDRAASSPWALAMTVSGSWQSAWRSITGVAGSPGIAAEPTEGIAAQHVPEQVLDLDDEMFGEAGPRVAGR